MSFWTNHWSVFQSHVCMRTNIWMHHMNVYVLHINFKYLQYPICPFIFSLHTCLFPEVLGLCYLIIVHLCKAYVNMSEVQRCSPQAQDRLSNVIYHYLSHLVLCVKMATWHRPYRDCINKSVLWKVHPGTCSVLCEMPFYKSSFSPGITCIYSVSPHQTNTVH